MSHEPGHPSEREVLAALVIGAALFVGVVLVALSLIGWLAAAFV